jgi:hypothetical protein
MAVLNDNVFTDAIKTIAPIEGHPAKHTASDPNINIPSHTNESPPETTETLHLNEGDVNVRTKIRTLAIVSALYFVLFIAALDQTIIA